MEIGIPRERRDLDVRVGLGVGSVTALVSHNHKVYVEKGAGEGAGFADEDYIRAGATIVYSSEEVYKRAEMICRVTTPTQQEIEEMQEGQIICCFAHLAAASPQRMERILQRKLTMVSYELLCDDKGLRCIQRPMSEIAGRLVPQIAASLMQSPVGRGLLLSGIPGLPPAEVTILGAGVVGLNAARFFASLGAQVTVLAEPNKLFEIDRLYNDSNRIRLMYSYPIQIQKAVAFADVLVGAVLIPGERTPQLVTKEMVTSMRPGSVIIDVSIDQGGCVETSRPTTLRDPTFIEQGITHYCAPNFTALVARTASRALSATARPYILRLANHPASLVSDADLRTALSIYQGHIVNRQLAAAHHMEAAKIED